MTTNKYASLDLGTIEAVFNKLGGVASAKQFLSGNLHISLSPPAWKTWRTIKLGTGLKTAEDFNKAIKGAKMNISVECENIIKSPAFSVSSEEVEVELIKVSLTDLGFHSYTKYADVCARAKLLGLKMCPAEVGLQLRLGHEDKPKYDYMDIVVAMETIPEPTSNNRPRIFGFAYDRTVSGKWWVLEKDGYQDTQYTWDLTRFLFLRK